MVLEAMAVLEHQQAAFLDPIGRDRREIRCFALRIGDEKPIRRDVDAFDIAACIGKREQHAVQLAAMERLTARLTGFLAKEEIEVGIGCAHAREQFGQQKRGDGRDDAETKVAGQGLTLGLRQGRERFGVGKDGPGLRDDLLAEGGEPHHAACALDERRVENGLEFAEPGRQRRLGHETLFGRASEMAMLVERHQILKLLEGGQVDGHLY